MIECPEPIGEWGAVETKSMDTKSIDSFFESVNQDLETAMAYAETTIVHSEGCWYCDDCKGGKMMCYNSCTGERTMEFCREE